MPKAEICYEEEYPVFHIWPKDEHWALPENFEFIDWLDVPQELIDEHKRAKEIWRKSQENISDFLNTLDR